MTAERRQKKHPNLRAGAASAESHENSARKVRGKPFEKGHARKGGRKPGTQNRATREVKALATSILEDPEVQERMLHDAQRGRLPPPVMTMLFHYAYGKPKERIEVQGALEVFKILVTDDLDDEMGRNDRADQVAETP
jgi:hypothetical protein